MLPSTHFIISLILGIGLFPYFGWQSFLVLISGFLIDVDHYMWYVYKCRDWNLLKAYDYYVKRKFGRKPVLNIFHLIEFWPILIILCFYSQMMYMILIGFIVHIVMDVIHNYKHKEFKCRINSLIFEWRNVDWRYSQSTK